MSATLYKVTLPDGSACHGGTGKWFLPRGRRPGSWMPTVWVKPCFSGYHVCTVGQLLDSWLTSGCTVWEVEIRGETQTQPEKTVAAEARLLRPVLTPVQQLLVVSDFAAHVAHLNDDPRVWAAIKATRDYAHGRIDSAALSAALYAAGRAARSDLGTAVWASARAASCVSARDVAWDADIAAGTGTERFWQIKHLEAVLAGKKQPGRIRRRKAAQ